MEGKVQKYVAVGTFRLTGWGKIGIFLLIFATAFPVVSLTIYRIAFSGREYHANISEVVFYSFALSGLLVMLGAILVFLGREMNLVFKPLDP